MTRRRTSRNRTRTSTSPPVSRKRQGLGGEQVEGVQAVRELLLVGRRKVREVLVARDPETGSVRSAVVGLADLADDMRVPVRVVSDQALLATARTSVPQGVVARAAPLPEYALEELVSGSTGSAAPPFLLAIDRVTDPGNLGALLRSAECFGVTGVVLGRHRTVHITPTVAKAAAGAIEHLPMAVVAGLPAALARLSELGVWVVGLDAGGDVPIDALEVADGSVCLVLGAEDTGLAPLTRKRCDLLAAIPLAGQLSSLNVATAGAIACYEVARRRPKRA